MTAVSMNVYNCQKGLLKHFSDPAIKRCYGLLWRFEVKNMNAQSRSLPFVKLGWSGFTVFNNPVFVQCISSISLFTATIANIHHL